MVTSFKMYTHLRMIYSIMFLKDNSVMWYIFEQFGLINGIDTDIKEVKLDLFR